MKYKEEVEKSIERVEQLALTLETVVNTPRLTDRTEIKRLSVEIRKQLKFISDRVSLEYNG
jgi:predicted DNA-binding protein